MSWDPRAPSYPKLADRVAASGATAVFVGGLLDTNAARVVRDLRIRLPRTVDLLAPTVGPLPLLVQRAGRAALGTYVSLPGVVTQRLSPAGARFVERFGRTQAGSPVVPSAVYAAQATEVLLDAIRRSDGTRSSVVEELFRTRVSDGLLGSFSFDRNGEGSKVARSCGSSGRRRAWWHPGARRLASECEARSEHRSAHSMPLSGCCQRPKSRRRGLRCTIGQVTRAKEEQMRNFTPARLTWSARRKPTTLVQVAAVTLALGISSVAPAAGGLSGTYSTTVKSPAEIKGKWVLALVKGGTYRVAYNGDWIARGTYSATSNAITFRESAVAGCGGTGTYAWRRSGRALTFTRKREVPRCQIRAVVLRHTFTRVG
jgi:hypothetical protein